MKWNKVFNIRNKNKMEADSVKSAKLDMLFAKYRAADIETDGELFSSRLFERLQNLEDVPLENKHVKQSGLRLVFSFSFLFLFVFVAAVFFVIKPGNEKMELVSSTETEQGKPVKIVLEYESDRDISGVEVLFKLEKGVRFYSENEKIRNLDEFVWTGDLKKGLNRIPFVVDLVEEGSWNILTQAGFDGFKHRHKIVLTSSNGKVAVYLYKVQNLSDSI